jgi:hypothetical protein
MEPILLNLHWKVPWWSTMGFAIIPCLVFAKSSSSMHLLRCSMVPDQSNL